MACQPPTPRLPDAPQPQAEQVLVDFKPLLKSGSASNSFAVERPATTSGGGTVRILLSPNLVFAASRSSAPELPTEGYRLAVDGAVAPGPLTATAKYHATGAAVPNYLSSMLVRFLLARGAEPVAPVIGSKWTPCLFTPCPSSTWVERMLLARRAQLEPVEVLAQRERSEGQPEGGSARYSVSVPKSVRLPDYALAVDELGLSYERTRGIVEWQTNALVVRAGRPDERSLCDLPHFNVPRVRLSLEVVDLVDGRLLARIDEIRPLEVGEEMAATVQAAEFKPVQATGYSNMESYKYIERWERVDVACQNLERAYQEVEDRVRKSSGEFVAATMATLFQEKLSSALSVLR
jgi:hypothetical protein